MSDDFSNEIAPPKLTEEMIQIEAKDNKDIPAPIDEDVPQLNKLPFVNILGSPKEELEKMEADGALSLTQKAVIKARMPPNLFITVFEKRLGFDIHEQGEEFVVPFKKKMLVGDLRKQIRLRFNYTCWVSLYLYEGKIFKDWPKNAKGPLKRNHQKVIDLQCSFIVAKITEKVPVYHGGNPDVLFAKDQMYDRYVNKKEGDKEEKILKPTGLYITVESDVHICKYLAVPCPEGTTVGNIRNFFGWKNNVLPDLIGLKCVDQVLKNDSKIVTPNMKLTAFSRTVRLPQIHSGPLIVPDEPVKRRNIYKIPEDKESKRNYSAPKSILIECKDLTPDFINLPIYKSPVKLTMKEIKEKISIKVGVFYRCLNIFKSGSDLVKQNHLSDDCPLFDTNTIYFTVTERKIKLPVTRNF